MLESNVGAIGRRWHQRSTRNKLAILALLAAAASLLPAAGSFVPRDSGNLLFGGVAQAACKWNGKPGPGSLTNRAERWWGWAYVRTGWCYSGGHVTARHSALDQGVTLLGRAFSYQVPPSYATKQNKYSACHYYNGYWNHNCLTRFEFTWWSFPPKPGADPVERVCIHTRIYGNGAHSRLITDGPCP